MQPRMMNTDKASLLFVTDLYYEAKGRAYYAEDLFLTSRLKEAFDLLICHPLHTARFESIVDLVVIRNSGPTIYYKEYFDRFFERVNREQIPTYNSMTGRGDMAGKDYLVQLTREQFPVIPTVDRLEDLHLLPATDSYIVKPKEGADSIGLRRLSRQELESTDLKGALIQPFMDFAYEVSFYFIDAGFQYALYAPDKSRRWKLERYTPSPEDLEFARRYINWNTVTHGIQRVDACRTATGELLLVELEDLNPFLSLESLDEETREAFVQQLQSSLRRAIGSTR